MQDRLPGPDEVQIDIEAASVIPGDWKLRAGHLQKMFDVALPKIPGRDGAGIVAAVGGRVAYARPGDAVCFATQHVEAGSYAESVIRDARSIVPMPPGLSFAEGAALMHAGSCAWIALNEAVKLEHGQRLLVIGAAGAIGAMAVQLGRHMGATVAGICSERNADYVMGLGAEAVFAYDKREAPPAGSFDVALDLVGGDAHGVACTALRPGGALAWLIAAPFRDRGAEFGVRTVQARIHDEPQVLRAVTDLARQGAWRPQVSRILPLAEAAEAHRLLEAGQNSRGRIVLDIRGRAAAKPAARGKG
jgi:NADPH:quinone reductase-like Zn-dependent oxidoreductase